MPRNGSGTMILPSGNPVVANTQIAVSWANPTMSDIANEVTNSIARDGQGPPTANISWGGFKITQLADGTADTDAATVLNTRLIYANVCDFRLTLTSGTPVTTSDVTGATSVYFSPYRGNRVAIYSASGGWITYLTSEITIPVVATANVPSDIFAYYDSGIVKCLLVAWTNATTRATALALQDGVLVSSADPANRYIGTICGSGVNITEDSAAKRFVWNYYNRARRIMRGAQETADNWSYSNITIRQANANTANKLDMVIGVSEDIVEAEILGSATTVTGGSLIAVGVGLDSTTTFTAGGLMPTVTGISGGTTNIGIRASWKGYPGAGRHFLSWNEASTAATGTTFNGDSNNPSYAQSGIHGSIFS